MGRAAGEQVQEEVDLSDTQSPEFTLPIDVVPGTDPPLFRWRHTVSTPAGPRTVDCGGPLPPSVEGAVRELIGRARQLQVFKTWVHAYLDAHKVPHHPPGTHGAAGCRIGDRMDWLVAELEAARSAASQRAAEVNNQSRQLDVLEAALAQRDKPNAVAPQGASIKKSKGAG